MEIDLKSTQAGVKGNIVLFFYFFMFKDAFDASYMTYITGWWNHVSIGNIEIIKIIEIIEHIKNTEKGATFE